MKHFKNSLIAKRCYTNQSDELKHNVCSGNVASGEKKSFYFFAKHIIYILLYHFDRLIFDHFMSVLKKKDRNLVLMTSHTF